MQPRVARREVAAAAEPRRNLAPAPGGHRYSGADAAAIGGDSRETQGQAVAGAGSRLMAEQGQRCPLADDQDVHAAVVVEVTDGQPAAQAEDLPGRPGPFGDVAEAA